MSRGRAAVMDQPGLFEVEPPRPARTETSDRRRPRPPIHTPRPRRTKQCQAKECEPKCLICGKGEGRGLCTPRCSVICEHTHQPDRVEVCLVTTHVTALLVTGERTLAGPRQLALVLCPFCGEVHWHAPSFGAHYRVAHCGQPYIVHLHRPRLAPGGTR
ncbi:hypothetical protein [Microbispora bryophytorum]|uniref:hypothetical protein n=1 Tax=Microbispora bryophytorum TaxID=1460882 RepID=UPI0033F60779